MRWSGFTDRLRRHGRMKDKTTQGYLDVAADRIEDLEDKLFAAERELKGFREAKARRMDDL